MAQTTLQDIDAAAACPICGEAIQAAMMLKSCGHSFCSSCIRQALDYQEEHSGSPTCPVCRSRSDARDLQVNPALRQVLAAYDAARPQLIAIAELATAVQQGQHGRKCCRRQPKAAAARGSSLALRGMRSSVGKAASQGGTRPGASKGPSMDLMRNGSSEHEANNISDDASSSVGEDSLSSNDSLSAKRQRRSTPRIYSRTGGRPGAGTTAAAATSHQHTKHSGRQQPRAEAPLSGEMASGFVRCPVCSRSIPAFFVNSHIDLCLSGGAAGGQHSAAARAQAGSESCQLGCGQMPAGPPAAAVGPFEPLPVPAKLVPSLASMSSLRAASKKHGLPAEGRKKELLERYNKLRLAVQLANDKQERTTYRRLARRVVQQERQNAALKMLSGGGRHATAVQAAATPGPADPVSADGEQEQIGLGFKALVAATRARDAHRRVQRAEAAAAQLQPPAVAEEVERAAAEHGAVAEAGAAASWDVDGGSGPLWEEELPLSQTQEPIWRHRLKRQHQQQEQQQPNSQPTCSASPSGDA